MRGSEITCVAKEELTELMELEPAGEKQIRRHIS